MAQKILKKVSGYNYSEEHGDWAVDTDYRNGKIYISTPTDEEDLSKIKAFGRAIVMAVQDMQKDCK